MIKKIVFNNLLEAEWL